VKKHKGDESRQLCLDFGARNEPTAFDSQPARGPRVVSFVDATTLALRREAIRRVRQSGIFSIVGDRLHEH
jgi:hypothetical protein